MIDRERQPYDKSSKWLIQHHGDSMLRLANVTRIAAWRPAQAEVVQPRRLPDGLLEVRLEGQPQDDLFLIEVATYPEHRELHSRHGLSSCRVNWRVVELWQIPGEDLLQAGDVGLIPWVPLTDRAGPPEKVMQRCREEIEKRAPAGEEANLLAVTQVLSYLRYNDVGLLTILGGIEESCSNHP